VSYLNLKISSLPLTFDFYLDLLLFSFVLKEDSGSGFDLTFEVFS